MSYYNLDLYYDTVLDLTKRAGAKIKEKNLDRDKLTQSKSNPNDFVTETDKEVEEFLIKSLSDKFPDHKFIGEECTVKQEKSLLTNAPTWIIDPIDGTMNFVHSFPHSCISIALYVNMEPEIGIVYNPILKQLFTARRGKGAFLNDKPIRVSNTISLSKALFILERFGGPPTEKAAIIDVVEHVYSLVGKAHSYRTLGSAALGLCMIACGAADVLYHYGFNIWDIAAGELIIKEAGGFVTDTNGGPIKRFENRILAASSKDLIDVVSKKLMESEAKLLKKSVV